jgi:hypothetical protein
MEHKCINKEIIEALRKEVEKLKTELEVQKSSISGIKDDIKGLKADLKEMFSKMNAGFKSIDKWLIGLLVTALFSFGGIAVTIILFLANK